ncbi:MAG: sulfatase [Candidatus Eisenbacteria bacterium]|nr:sulfatase [Candidatus Eisenbacteria bacterium]
MRGSARRAVAYLFALAALSLAGCGGGDARSRPNILLVTIDTVRPDHLGAYGSPSGRTPNIDRLSAGGTLYTEAFSAAPWTLPSMATIMTSRYPSQHGAYWVDRRIDGNAPSIAEELRRAGYATAGFHGHLLVSSLYGFDKGFERFVELDVDLEDEDKAFALARQARQNQPQAEDINREALVWLREEAKEPFFLWVHYFDPHLPYQPPDRFRRAFDEGPSDMLAIRGRPPQEYFQPEIPMPEPLRRQLIHLYEGEIFAADLALGDLLAAYRERFDDEPLVVLLSDHGEEFKEHGRLSHTKTLYDELIRIPLLVSGPGFARGALVSSAVRTVDVLPTVLRAAGVGTPAGIEGEPLPLQAETNGETRVVLAETRNRSWEEDEGQKVTGSFPLFLRSIQRGEWKTILSILDGAEELYSLEADPRENADRGADLPDTIARFLGDYERFAAEGGPFGVMAGEPADTADVELSPEQIENLRALGYVR